MPHKIVNVVIAGLGGQGVIKASDILSDAAFRAGYDVKKAEVHGMSQRGGSLSTDVRYGDVVLSPMIPKGETDFLVILEPTQVEPNVHLLKNGGVLLTPEIIDPSALANRKSFNVAMMGALSAHLDIPESEWLDSVRGSLPEKHHEVNIAAFQYGKETEKARMAAAGK